MSSLGRVKNIKTKRILKGDVDKFGHVNVRLFNNGNYKVWKVHRLVAEAFIPNPKNKPEVNHKDSNPSNNHINNLEWVTHRENILHAQLKGRLHGRKNELHHNAKLTDLQIIEIRVLREQGNILQDLANKYDVSFQHISRIVNNKTRVLNL